MNAPAETAPAPATNPAYLRVLEALVSLNEPADRERIATKAGISPDGAGVQLVALAGKRIVVRCPQPKGAPALWSLAVSLDTARQMVDGMKRAAAEASPAADDRRRIIAAMREIGAPASAFGIAKKSGVDLSVVSVMLEVMTADGTVQRIPGSTGQRPKFALAPSVQSLMPAATDGEPGDGEPAPEPGDTQAVDAVEAAPDPGGWIPWRGGECPVPEGVACWVRLRDGLADICHTPERLFWGRGIDEDNEDDIVAYRLDGPPVAQTPAQNPDGWIPWHGGECPVPAGSRCSIRIRCADAAKCVRNPEEWWWGRREDCQAGDGDIIAYRPEPKQTGPASFDDPDDFRDGDDKPAAADDPYGLDYDPRAAETEAVAYDALVEAEAAADAAPLAGEDVNGEADVLEDRRERYTDPVEAAAEQIAAAVAAGHCPTVALLIQRASPVAEEAAQRAIDAAEAEALMREEEADVALDMARDARVRGRAVAEIIRFAEQRAGLAGDADPDAVLIAIVELLDGARSAVTGMSRPA